MVKIFVCGDFRAKNPSIVKTDDMVRQLMHDCDYCICNFEAPVVSSGIAIKKSGPLLDQDYKSPQLLEEMGFNVILLANNHIMDYGEEGCKATIAAFKRSFTLGVGSSREAFQLKIIEREGVKIGMLSFVQHEFGVVESKNEKNSYGAAWINSPDVCDIIWEAKKSVDYLLIFPHAGVEHTDAPLPQWRTCYKKLVDWGADAIIASHPHCPQGWEVYKDRYIFYSLGNFYFDELDEGELWHKSLAVEIDIDTCLQYKTYNLQFDNEGSISIDISDKSKKHIDCINKLLSDQEAYEKYINKVCIEHYQGMKYGILRGVCGFTFFIRSYYALRLFVLMMLRNKDELYLLNTIQNESHRWLIERYLKTNNKII